MLTFVITSTSSIASIKTKREFFSVVDVVEELSVVFFCSINNSVSKKNSTLCQNSHKTSFAIASLVLVSVKVICYMLHPVQQSFMVVVRVIA